MEATLAAELALGLPDLEAMTLALLASTERLDETEAAADEALADAEEAELLRGASKVYRNEFGFHSKHMRIKTHMAEWEAEAAWLTALAPRELALALATETRDEAEAEAAA